VYEEEPLIYHQRPDPASQNTPRLSYMHSGGSFLTSSPAQEPGFVLQIRLRRPLLRDPVMAMMPNLLDLPVEIRHGIYRHLFLHENPVAIGTRYIGLRFGDDYDPVFYTPFFRVSKRASYDAISYAYGKNQLVLKDTFKAFTSLSSIALAAIEHLTVVHSSWTAEHESEGQAWSCLKAKCTGLRDLEVELHSDLLLQTVRYLSELFRTLPRDHPRPSLKLDLYVWAGHFDFDGGNRDYSRSLQMLRGGHKKTPSTPNFADPKVRIQRLPSTATSIVLSADLNAATVQALDDFLDEHDEIPLIKTTEPISKTGRRSLGRTNRFCYTWKTLVS
jgi:hypothetical protein